MEPQKQYKINEDIKVSHVRLVGDNVEPKIVSIEEAMQLSEELELDLVMITEESDPPVCKIMDYTKFLYDQKKKQKELKSKTVKTVIKEIRFGPNTDDHDLDFKIRNGRKFLEEGSKVKAFVFFRGRSIVFQARGHETLARFIAALEDVGKVEAPPKLEGKRLTVFLQPMAKKK